MARAEQPAGGRRDARGAAVGGGRLGSTRRRPALGGTRALFAVAFLGASALIAWGIADRGDTQVPILVTGLLVLALTLVSLAAAGVIGAYRSGRTGDTGHAFWSALLGGIAAVAAWGCLAAAAVLALLYSPRG